MSDLHHPYDKAARHAAKHSGARLLSFIFPSLAADIAFIRWVDARSQPDPSEEDRTCDVVAELSDPQKPGRSQILIIEFQARPRGDEASRGFEYATRIHFELARQEDRAIPCEVFVSFVYLTGRRDEPPIDAELRGTRARTLHCSESFAFADINLESFLTAIAADPSLHVLLYWAPLMQGADDPAKIQEWLRLAKKHFPKPLRSNLRVVALAFAELAGRAAIWIDYLKDWNVSESLLLQQWTAEAEARTQRNNVLRIIESRFSKRIAQDIRKKIQSENRMETLDSWFDAALKAETLSDFRKAIGL